MGSGGLLVPLQLHPEREAGSRGHPGQVAKKLATHNMSDALMYHLCEAMQRMKHLLVERQLFSRVFVCCGTAEWVAGGTCDQIPIQQQTCDLIAELQPREDFVSSSLDAMAETDPKSVQDLTNVVQTLLQQMQDKFQTMSDQIIGRNILNICCHGRLA
ncbi:hypothetical protein CCH79_00013002 [Gambusia affinis]|uniref:Heat shock factor-binding protein 1 n=1 Tax=Gambusia affinis TaxID=33528 RepID=A0A315WDE9_GAMAF|nr:hypothetical protein CCH79_00013002 [Gambusia affinis]